MKIVFRWYGKDDKITLDQIRQIPVVDGIASAVYDVAAGGVWSDESIEKTVDGCRAKGLPCEVVESVPVHEDIKLGLPSAKKYIENYKENIRRLAKYGVKCVCYNFMPVFDWVRSELEYKNADGSNSLAYVHEKVLKLNPLTSDLSLPGWDASYKKDELRALLNKYKSVGDEELWANLEVFLKEIIPVAEEVGVKMAIHPDDPPWSIFGLPRIVVNKENLLRLVNIVDSPSNGVTLCTGSLGCSADNDLIDIIKSLKGKIPYAHIRNVKRSGDYDFCETAHPSACGSLDVYAVFEALFESAPDCYVRPDHGRMIWGETGRYGYGLYDRALGACYIGGIIESFEKRRK